MKKFTLTALLGTLTGIVNGMLGAGGGMIAVPALRKLGLDKKDSHANAVAVILPLAVFSAALYLYEGRVALTDPLIYIPSGLVGAVIGTFIMKKITAKNLGRLFGAFMIFAGVRMILR